MKLRITLTISIMIFLSACSFNKMFLQPTSLPKLPPDKDKVSITTTTKYDTTLVEFNTKSLKGEVHNNIENQLEKTKQKKNPLFKG